MNRGDVFDAQLGPVVGSEQDGPRPVAIVSRQTLNDHRPTIVIVPFTRFQAARQLTPTRVVVRAPEGGLSEDSLALTEQVRTISKQRLLRYRGRLRRNTMAEIEAALIVVLDLPEPY
jgi:mRNA interferase MazF